MLFRMSIVSLRVSIACPHGTEIQCHYSIGTLYTVVILLLHSAYKRDTCVHFHNTYSICDFVCEHTCVCVSVLTSSNSYPPSIRLYHKVL